MVVLVAAFLIVAVILMLVLLEKNTGGKDGGVGCVSGAVILALLVLIATQFKPADGDRLAGEFRQLLGVGLGVAAIIGVCYLGYAFVANYMWDAPKREGRKLFERDRDEQVRMMWAAGAVPYFNPRDPRLDSKRREVRAAFWVDALSLLDDDAYEGWLEHHRDEIRRDLTPEDWRAIGRRREAWKRDQTQTPEGVGNLISPHQIDSANEVP